MNGNNETTPTAGRRRKARDDEEEDWPEDRSKFDKGHEETLVPGCGRMVCRSCCLEDSMSNTTTCRDCYSQH
ncbi:hypothetical protein GLOTRDRAFT_111858 [Gloeophyllum trabeum ATCC 11539]|uniref:Uncharacterized protein n=1 Tax=Gloeophyllum trabeum (strain ATCC 11539 / FP-39264 / Madison 617) TaxID=670483 RepID=S7PZL9_GLOTA|nr:uncharacterized protein GLOTRDRAFT_111858 [Gloeophyllum trabeum ATCC 11539]EPQ53111.1 hypothetical protein GLOTRDRAFT_111858 [Gloeophyllum trabeum ATCC 11539]